MYEPKIEIVRASPMGRGVWNDEDGQWPDMERAYLVRGIPMPGERVMHRDGTVHTVRNLRVKWVEVHDGSHRPHRLIKALRPYAPDAERLRVATEAVERVCGDLAFQPYGDIARAVLDALKEVADG